MARYWFGQGPADWTMTLGDGGAVFVEGGVAVTMWSAATGGTQYTDLLDASLTPITAVTSADGSGALPAGTIPAHQGPDGVAEMWADAGGGVRYRLFGSLASDVLALLAEVESLQNAVENLQAVSAAAPVTVLYDEGASTWPERPAFAGSRIVFWFGPAASPPPSGSMLQNDQFFGWAS